MRGHKPTLLGLYAHLLCRSEIYLGVRLEGLEHVGGVDTRKGDAAMRYQVFE